MSGPRWEVKKIDGNLAERIRRRFSLNPVVAAVLAARGFEDDDRTARFLNADLNDLLPPGETAGMEEAAERIFRAVKRGERILVYGDYDVDGITATSILVRLFTLCGVPCEYFIPDRMEDGYGISMDAARKVVRRGCPLLVTVDCGIAAAEPVAFLRRQGMDVVITDHHLPGEEIPDTPFIVNPAMEPGRPYESLSAAGVAFKLAWAVAQKVSGTERVRPRFRKFLVSVLPLAAVGIVADIVELTGESRILASRGISLLSPPTPIIGLNALMRTAGLGEAREITTFDIGYRIGPRLNAAGRMDNAAKCVRLLTTESPEEAEHIAAELERHNRERQKLCERTVKQAFRYIEEKVDLSRTAGLVAASAGWHRGIIGIVASKIVDRYRRPAVVMCRDEESPSVWHASARSVPGFHITNTLKACGDIFLNCGGHQGAAGFSIEEKNIGEFKKRFEETTSRLLDALPTEETIRIDAEAAPEHIDVSLARDMRKLGPFGEGNEPPLLLARGIPIAHRPRLVGTNETHLKLRLLPAPGRIVETIGFNMAHKIREVINASLIDIVFFPSLSEWRGRTSLDLHIKDVKEHGGV